jgi:branched-chain amino acid aminotransferase
MVFVLHRLVLHNDRVQEAADLALSPGQVGLLSGWGVFSTLRVADGVLFAWERHWARITRDAKALHVPLPEDSERVRTNLLELVEANGAPNCTLRLVIVRNGGGMWAGPSNGRASDVIALTSNSKEWGDGVKLAYQREARHAASQVILLNERGEVAECTSANIFIADGNQVWTPPLGSGCLPGITREVLLGEVRVPGIRIGEKALMPTDLELADEVFITSTTRDLLPVMQIEARKVGRSERARQALTAAFSAFVQKYVAKHKAAPATR